MRHLRQRDFHAILEIVEELYSYQAPEECEIGMAHRFSASSTATASI